MVKVSIIMPIYNAAEYLSTALDSLLGQTLKEIEIICVDDGSTDDSERIVSSYQERDARIILLKQKNSYAGVARNHGMSIAKGKYLAFLDSDDYFKPEMLEKAYRNAEQQNADIVIFGGMYFTDDIENATYQPGLLREDRIPDGIGFDNVEKIEDLMTITTPAPWNKLFLHTFVKKYGLKFQPYKRANDVYFVEMAIACADRIGIVREGLIYYRIGNSKSLQGTNSETPGLFAAAFTSVQEKLKELGLYEKVKKSFQNLCLDNCIYNLEGITDATAFENLYMDLKRHIFKDLQITESCPKDFYDRYGYEWYLYIISHSPIEYWMDRYDKLWKSKSKEYLFPYQMVHQGSRIILYGGGRVGKVFYRQIKKSAYCHLMLWVDRNVKEYYGQTLCLPENALWSDCDYIVIAIADEKMAGSIKEELFEKYHVPYHKMIWQDPLL